jgi:glycosyltransferase involved in cell wall biosynthesis
VPETPVSVRPEIVRQRSAAEPAGALLKVAYVTQWFAPEPGNVPLWIALAMRRQGLDVGVVTAVPNYPAGKTYPGYPAWRRTREMVEGFAVVRSPVYPSHGRSAAGRIVNLVSYAVSSSHFGRTTLKSADVALVYSSPATAAVAAMRARRRWGLPYVLLVLDLWPDSVFASGFLARGWARRAAERALRSFTQRAYDRAAHVAVTAPGMRELLIERGVPAAKISVIYNWVDELVMRPAEADEALRPRLGLTGQFILMYAGNHGAAQGLDVAIRAMDRLRADPRVHLVLVGDGSEKTALRDLAERLKLSSVHFVDRVDADRIPGLMAAADLQLVSLADEALFRITMPSKVQSIMACAQPILLSAGGDAARAVETAGAGLTCRPGDPEALAIAIERAAGLPSTALAAMGRAGQEYYRAHLSEAVNSRALAEALRSAAGTAGK